jgi:hypothetical protein
MRLSAILLAAAIAAGTAPPKLSKAEIWSEAVAQFVTDPQFYRQVPVERIKARFLPLLRPEQLSFNTGPGLGSNPEMGIVDVFTNLRSLAERKSGIEQLRLLLPPTDPDGNLIYPILKAKLLRRLRKPVWNLIVDDKAYFWRKGKTPYIISVDFNSLYGPKNPFPDGGLGPFVVVEAGWEEGDSEDP